MERNQDKDSQLHVIVNGLVGMCALNRVKLLNAKILGATSEEIVLTCTFKIMTPPFNLESDIKQEVSSKLEKMNDNMRQFFCGKRT